MSDVSAQPFLLRNASIGNPEISVLMPVHNAEPFLREAIQSILAQTRLVFELIAVDDASTDGSLEILNSMDDDRITVARLPKQSGAAAARNYALSLVRAPWICLFDADDIMLPDVLTPYFHWTSSQPEAVWAYCALELVDRDRKSLNQQFRNPFDLCKMLQRNILPQPMTLLKTTLIKQVGGYDATLRTCEDYDLWFRLLEFAQPVFYNHICLLYRQHGANLGRVTTSHNTVFNRLNARLQTRADHPRQEMRREQLRRICQFIQASDRNDIQAVRQLGSWLCQQGVEGFECDRRLAESFLAGGDPTTAMGISLSWIERVSQGQFLLPYEMNWALVFSVQTAIRIGQSRVVSALLPMLESVASVPNPDVQSCIQQARRYLAVLHMDKP
jgi:hypothetical protein